LQRNIIKPKATPCAARSPNAGKTRARNNSRTPTPETEMGINPSRLVVASRLATSA